MPEIGQSLLHYSILEKIGKGGMGEVFRAKDQKLGRDVAVKLLPEEFARDADRVARFQREAKLLASLNHPNIAAIYGLEESGKTNFLVMELVEGQTLADRIKAGAIPVEESLKLALQIAEALEAAHEKGVIHRDLKPANIKVTPDGKVKVLDFGLAKAYAGEQAESNLSNSPTLSDMATQQGVILGTAAYMSPEQARGKAVDKRADIWAFGCVLFEMLTGQAAFQGEDVTEILASVVKGGANLDLLPANLHPRVREAITRCLQKDLKRRYQGMADASYEIGQALATPGGVLTQPVTTAEPPKRLRVMLPWIAATAILGVIIGGLVVWKFRPAEPRDVMRSEYSLPDGQQFAEIYAHNSLAVSPDGKLIVYSAAKGLYIRSVNELTAKPIAGIEEKAISPFFSPDGKWIGYISATDMGKLKKVAVGGGAPEVLCAATTVQAWWVEDGTIIYPREHDIMRVSEEGGTPESILNLKSGALSRPQMLPDGKSILYTSRPNNGQPKIMVQTLKSGQAKELFTGLEAQYVPTGHIIYRLPNNNNLFAVQFDLAGLNVKGQSATMLEGIVQYAISQSGTLAYIPVGPGAAAAKKTFVWVNREGKEEVLPVPPNNYHKISISHDGKRVALEVTNPNANIWIWDIIGKNMRPLTSDEGASNASPLWTIDGKRILYAWDRENVFKGGVYWRAADGSGEAEKLASVAGRGLFPNSLSPDGKSLVLWEIVWSPTLHQAIGLLSMEGGRARRDLLHDEKYSMQAPRVSPNGKWMAYESYESGKPEIYVCSFPDAKKGTKVSEGGGNSPLWSPDGRELFYNNVDATMAVPVETEPQFKINGMPTVLFRGTAGKDLGPNWADMANFTYWDIDPDPDPGHLRFLMMKDASETPRKIHIVVNWTEELKRKVPIK